MRIVYALKTCFCYLYTMDLKVCDHIILAEAEILTKRMKNILGDHIYFYTNIS